MLGRVARLPARGFKTGALFSTVVEDEVRKFNAASSDWWAPKSTTGVGPLHQINPVRVKYIRSHVIGHFGRTTDDDPMPLRGLRVADVGCGGGILSEALCRIGGTMVSADPGEDNIAAAKNHAAMSRHTSSIDYRQCTSAALAIGAAEYVMRIVPPGTHDWNKFVQPGEIETELRKDGFTVKDVSGIVGDPIFRSWCIHPTCTDINYILCATKPQE
ncbi:hypothetical protein AM588_10005200 [Phytophthora nicotianae]|uniref:Methyltransferase type 11 domain-containing protein n=1 Tax=Phytophthora nicotianae TaxID=4792 RepID=A0A0W8DFQ9_PHYNI|nr:hypothetical protein AM588_10005200 [Phytophthora nicotianae]